MKLSIAHKLSLGSTLLVLLSVGVVGGVFYSKTTDLLVQHSLDDISSEIRDAGLLLQTLIENQREDVLFLAHTPPIQGILRSRKGANHDELGDSSYKQWLQRLNSIFQSQLKRKSAYLKIRFIDAQGRELVVVGREGAEIVSYGPEQLQNKAHRTYVRDTLKLAEGSVYLSEFNLNREHGQVSQPHQEVLRSATPVYDEQSGELAGLVVVAIEIGDKLRKIQQRIQGNSSSEIYITNDRGGYLLHPDPSKTYGFDLGKRYRVQEDFPHLARLFLPDNQIRQLTMLPEHTDGQHVADFTKILFDPSRPERFIAVIITQDYAGIVSRQSAVLNDVLRLALAMALIGTLLGVLFAINLTRPIKQMTQAVDDFAHQRETTANLPVHQGDEVGVLARRFNSMVSQVEDARMNLQQMNQDLEKMVAKRTCSLQESELRQRTIVENMVDGLVIINEKGFIQDLNYMTEEIFGYEIHEMIGENVKMLMPEPYRSQHDTYLENYLRTGDARVIGKELEVQGRRKDGTVFPLELVVSEMSLDSQRVFSGFMRDITERKYLDKMKTEFISTVSHELRTPLTSIRGSLGLIRSGLVGELPEQVKDMLKIAGNNTERLLLLINDLLNIQKLESGQMDFKFQDLDLLPFLEQALEDNAAYGEQYGVRFVIVDRLENAWVLADPARLMQVAANLLSNAAKFSPEDGTVEVGLSRRDGVLRFSVTDYGPGIPEDFQPKLFDKFTQSDSSDTRQKGGTGLGLSIAKVIVEKHSGDIDFVSKEGVGTTFFVDLPESRRKSNTNKMDDAWQSAGRNVSG